MKQFNFVYTMQEYVYLFKIILKTPKMSHLCNDHTISVILRHVNMNKYNFTDFDLYHFREYNIILYVLRFTQKLVYLSGTHFSEEICDL